MDWLKIRLKIVLRANWNFEFFGMPVTPSNIVKRFVKCLFILAMTTAGDAQQGVERQGVSIDCITQSQAPNQRHRKHGSLDLEYF